MRTKSRSHAQRHAQQRRDYLEAHPHCELWPYVTPDIRNYAPQSGQNQVHHIAGRGRYGEVPGNWITVTPSIHDWLSDHTYAGFVACAFVRERRGRADWETWRLCKKHYRRSALATDLFIEACGAWPLIDSWRLQLLEQKG